MQTEERYILITGAARRIGRALSLAASIAGWNIVIHHGHSPKEASKLKSQIEKIGRKAFILQADLENPEASGKLVERAFEIGRLYAVINSAAVFDNLDITNTSIADWQHHLNINLTAPFLICQSYGRLLPRKQRGRILNILDWRALRPGADHLPYTISKAALVALTKSLAIAFAPRISVNGLALGAVLPPSDGGESEKVLKYTPFSRFADLDEVTQAALFLLEGPEYITGEILHLDGGRHLI